MNFRKKISILSIILFVLLATVIGCNNKEENKEAGDILAKYKGGTVTTLEFEGYVDIVTFFNPDVKDFIKEKGNKEKLLDLYISEEYIYEKAENKDFGKEAQAALETIKNQKIQKLGSNKAYQNELKDLGLSEDDLLGYLNKYFAREAYFVEQADDEYKKQFTLATVSHILVEVNDARTDDEAKKRAQEVAS